MAKARRQSNSILTYSPIVSQAQLSTLTNNWSEVINPLSGYGGFVSSDADFVGNKHYSDYKLHTDGNDFDLLFWYDAANVIADTYGVSMVSAINYVPAVDDASPLKKSKIVHLFQDMYGANYWLPTGREINYGFGDTSVYTVSTRQSGSVSPLPPGVGPTWTNLSGYCIDVWAEKVTWT